MGAAAALPKMRSVGPAFSPARVTSLRHLCVCYYAGMRVCYHHVTVGDVMHRSRNAGGGTRISAGWMALGWLLIGALLGASCVTIEQPPAQPVPRESDDDDDTDSTGTAGSGGTAIASTSAGGSDPSGGGGDALELWRDAVVTFYSFQDNSACNSTMTASGLPLVPYVSVAVPFRFLEDEGDGPFTLGDEIFVDFLVGRAMPDGSSHSGWVRIDDFCGDNYDDSYCLQDGDPNIDLYVGDWANADIECIAQDQEAFGTGTFSGPAGSGQEPTDVFFGPAPAGGIAESYGGLAMGEGNCGDCEFGRTIQPPACWHYDPGSTNIEWCDCSNSNGLNGECD